ncbi:hypothetical protein SDC9_68105 [bioreactor metagenome]|uniref:Uncharacterized protein n=1 Tax=bioreactor metagenome TaxID=1076179 RepID=A0A644XZJ9_9ZZZZ
MGKGAVRVPVFGMRLRTQHAHQHDSHLGPSGFTVKVVTFIRTGEHSDCGEVVGKPLIVGGAYRRSKRKNQNGGNHQC